MSHFHHMRLRELREQVRQQLTGLSESDGRHQFHPELSPMAWHVGHSFFTEAYWVQEIVCGQGANTRHWHPLYLPEYSPKKQRGLKLPEAAELLAWTRKTETQTEHYWEQAARSGHSLLHNDYLQHFLIQHYAQHLETMAMVAQQARLASTSVPASPAALQALTYEPEFIHLTAGRVNIGAQAQTGCYDNELGAHEQNIMAFELARRPVSNGHWLAFMQDGAYLRSSLWDAAGGAWLAHTQARHPQHWRAHPAGGWYCPDTQEQLATDAPVHGICWHEAMAFARWAGACLPHEYEWEYAARQNKLVDTGKVWEWCSNTLHPYPGFRAFPYDGYSKPWFDGRHRIARGASRHTRKEILRPSFRNFYPESHRHVFAGLRLARN